MELDPQAAFSDGLSSEEGGGLAGRMRARETDVSSLRTSPTVPWKL